MGWVWLKRCASELLPRHQPTTRRLVRRQRPPCAATTSPRIIVSRSLLTIFCPSLVFPCRTHLAHCSFLRSTSRSRFTLPFASFAVRLPHNISACASRQAVLINRLLGSPPWLRPSLDDYSSRRKLNGASRRICLATAQRHSIALPPTQPCSHSPNARMTTWATTATAATTPTTAPTTAIKKAAAAGGGQT